MTTEDEHTKHWIMSSEWELLRDLGSVCGSRPFWEGVARGISAQAAFFTSTDHIWKSLEDFDSVRVAWSSVGHALDTAIVEAAEQLEQSSEEIPTEAANATACQGAGSRRELASSETHSR